MNELYLIRHGEAEHLLKGMVGGWSDTSLTEKGRTQAALTGKRLHSLLQNKPINYYASDLSRASDTASIIGGIISSSPVIVQELRELNNGVAANKTKEQAEQLKLPMTDPILDWIPYPEAESWAMMHDRVARYMEQINKDSYETTVIVTHSNTIHAIIHWWLGFDTELISSVSFDIDPCSITLLNRVEWSGSTNIAKLNDTCHLECDCD
ncbi:histidine phosphatase family protein [Paenibacillus albus]|uniref:Histidine phosphatase family protein n=1 Tax=Paenibacillus albus TaxID=2495582 RepID=A0A3S9A291_9BACL|nr:histidine phosphatase family protein [Paenibacillus albus]AZN39831.1 histidine phosphatase family protein [Paenibacillus albus]